MNTDGSAIDREALIDWVNNYLRHLEGIYSGRDSEIWTDDPATVIVDTIMGATISPEDGLQNQLSHFPNILSLFRNHKIG